MITTNNTFRAGLIGLIVGCTSLAVLPSADAATAEAFTFAFSYDAKALTTVEGRAQLDKRLDREAGKHCRKDFGTRSPIAAVRDCQRDLVKAVKFALEDETINQRGNCVTVAIAPGAMRTEVCGAI